MTLRELLKNLHAVPPIGEMALRRGATASWFLLFMTFQSDTTASSSAT